MRPGCDRPAIARLAYDAVQCRLWLEPLPQHSAPVQELCAFHVERLTVPRGWTVIDRREPEPEPEPDGRAESDGEAEVARVAVAAAVEEPAVAADPEPVPQPESVPEPVPEPQPEAVPVLQPEPDSQPEPEPRPAAEPAARAANRRRKPAGPLLERAFALTSEQRSVLTQGDDARRD